MVKQKIEGDNNIQLGTVHGSVFIDKRRPHFLPNDPNVVDCPYKCGQKTWFNSDKCWNCDRPVAQYFEYQEKLEQQKKIKRFNMIFSIVMNTIAMIGGISLIYLIGHEPKDPFGSLFSMLGYPMLVMGTVLNFFQGVKYYFTRDD